MHTCIHCIGLHHSAGHVFISIQPAAKAVEYLTDSCKLLLLTVSRIQTTTHTHARTHAPQRERGERDRQKETERDRDTERETETQRERETETERQRETQREAVGKRTERTLMGVETRSQMTCIHYKQL